MSEQADLTELLVLSNYTEGWKYSPRLCVLYIYKFFDFFSNPDFSHLSLNVSVVL